MRTVNDETELPKHVRRNRVHWDARAAEYVGPGERAWARQWPSEEIWKARRRADDAKGLGQA